MTEPEPTPVSTNNQLFLLELIKGANARGMKSPEDNVADRRRAEIIELGRVILHAFAIKRLMQNIEADNRAKMGAVLWCPGIEKVGCSHMAGTWQYSPALNSGLPGIYLVMWVSNVRALRSYTTPRHRYS